MGNSKDVAPGPERPGQTNAVDTIWERRTNTNSVIDRELAENESHEMIEVASGPIKIVPMGNGDASDEDAEMTAWLLDPNAEWPMDIYTATYLLWNMTEQPSIKPEPLSFFERSYRRLALFCAFALSFVLQVIVPFVLIFGVKSQPLRFTNYPLCSHQATDADEVDPAVCHDGAKDRFISVCLWLGTLTTVLLTVLGSLYVEFKASMRMLIQIHNSGPSLNWLKLLCLLVIWGVHFVAATVAFVLTFFVTTATTDAFHSVFPPMLNTIKDAVAVIYLTTADDVIWKALSATSADRLFPADLKKLCTKTAPPAEPAEDISRRLRYYSRAVRIFSDYIFLPAFVFCFLAAFSGWSTDCYDPEQFAEFGPQSQSLCGVWFGCKADSPETCSCCYQGPYPRFFHNSSGCADCTVF